MNQIYAFTAHLAVPPIATAQYLFLSEGEGEEEFDVVWGFQQEASGLVSTLLAFRWNREPHGQ
jgi:hypothetical protein